MSSITSYCQRFENKILNEDIQINVGLKFNSNPSYPTSKITFNKKGNITFIYKGILNPIKSESPKYYCAEYKYSDNDLLDEEIVYEVEKGENQRLRITKYDYKQDTLLVKVWDKEGELLAEMMEFKNNDGIKRNYISDNVLGSGYSLINNSTVFFNYNEGELIGLTQKNFQFSFERELKIQRRGRMKIISDNIQNDTMNRSNEQFRFYDKKGRLVKIGSEDKSRKWYTKYSYGKGGIITKITRRGRMHKTGEKVKSIILFHTKISKELKRTDNLTKKINDEIINMYYPITGKMQYLNYFDSRRFISHHG